MEWTPGRIRVVLFVDGKLHRLAMRESMATHAMAARGDPKAIQKMLKDESE